MGFLRLAPNVKGEKCLSPMPQLGIETGPPDQFRIRLVRNSIKDLSTGKINENSLKYMSLWHLYFYDGLLYLFVFFVLFFHLHLSFLLHCHGFYNALSCDHW